MAIFLFLNATPAYAFDCVNAPNQVYPADPSTKIAPLPSGFKPGDPYKGFINRIVGCVTDRIYVAGIVKVHTIRTGLKNIILATCTLALILYGYRVIFNANPSFKSSSAVMMMKLAAVIFFTIGTGLDIYFPLVLKLQQEVTELVTITFQTGKAGGNTAGVCFDMSKWGLGAQAPTIWAKIDCLVAGLMGSNHSELIDIKLDSAAAAKMATLPFAGLSGTALSPYITLMVVAGALFTTKGPMVVMLFFGFTMLMFAAILTAMLAYIWTVISMVMLLVVAPIVIPLYLFRTEVSNIFIIWARLLFGLTLQPMILFGYLSFAIAAIGMVWSGIPGSNLVPLNAVMRNAYESINSNPAYKAILTTTSPNISGIVANVFGQQGNAAGTNSIPVPVVAFNFNSGRVEVGDYESPNLTTDEWWAHFVVNLIILLLMKAVILTFLANIINLGPELAGVGGSNWAKRNSFIFKAAVGTMRGG